MDYKKIKNIVDGIVENEFNHVQETLEADFENIETEEEN